MATSSSERMSTEVARQGNNDDDVRGRRVAAASKSEELSRSVTEGHKLSLRSAAPPSLPIKKDRRPESPQTSENEELDAETVSSQPQEEAIVTEKDKQMAKKEGDEGGRQDNRHEDQEQQVLTSRPETDSSSKSSNQAEDGDAKLLHCDDNNNNNNSNNDTSDSQTPAEEEHAAHDSNNAASALTTPPVAPAVSVKPSKLLSLAPLQPRLNAIEEPRPPRAATAGTCSAAGRLSSIGTAAADGLGPCSSDHSKGTRLKFQFSDDELVKLMLENASAASPSASAAASALAPRATRRRVSTSVMLRRKSFNLTKSPLKGHVLAAAAVPHRGLPEMVSPAKVRWNTRRRSTSACVQARRGSALARGMDNATAAAAAAAIAASSSSSSSSSSSQMLVRVRERKSDGMPEVVICKRPPRAIVWQWNDRQVRVPCAIQLGPHQHGVMLRQLRYVKSVMNDFPWAKAHLKSLLAAYTKKTMAKEQLYPHLNLLSQQVQSEIGTHVRKQRQLVAKKQRLTMQLSLAAGVVNEMPVTKYGRRGKPHATKLRYDPGQPTHLHWVRKNGEQSAEALDVDTIELHCPTVHTPLAVLSAPLQRALRKAPPGGFMPEAWLSLVTATRTLDLQLKSGLHRDWLVNALQDVISFARQYRAVGAGRRAPSTPATSQSTANGNASGNASGNGNGNGHGNRAGNGSGPAAPPVHNPRMLRRM